MLTNRMEINYLRQWQLISQKRFGCYMPLRCVIMRLNGIFTIVQHEKTLNKKNPNPERCNTKRLWTPLGLVGHATSWARNMVMLSPFGTYDTLLEGLSEYYNICITPLPMLVGPQWTSKKNCLVGQNCSKSSQPEKLLKILNA